MDQTVEMPMPSRPIEAEAETDSHLATESDPNLNPGLDQKPALGRGPNLGPANDDEPYYLDHTGRIDPRLVAMAAGVVALLALLLTAAALTIAVNARSEARAAQENRDTGRAEAAEALRGAAALFDNLAQTQLAVDVAVDEVVPIEATLPLDQTYQIPLKTTVQVQQDVTISIPIRGILGDRTTDVNVPLDLAVPIDTEVPFTFNEPIDLSTETRIQAEVPVQLDLSETELAPLAQDVGDELIDLAVILEQDQ